MMSKGLNGIVMREHTHGLCPLLWQCQAIISQICISIIHLGIP